MKPDFLVIDFFCGLGGTTEGLERARIARKKIAKVIACVNHSEIAIFTHSANHPKVMHFREDFRTLAIRKLKRHVMYMRRKYPLAKLVAWFSHECTHFSGAAGGQPKDDDSRTLADHSFRYFELDFDMLWLENVGEFKTWGPLDENKKPIKERKGEDYTRWVKQVKSYGYEYEDRMLNAADFGAYTSRDRYFGIFAKPGIPIAWPEPTHAKNPTPGLFRDGIRKWKSVKDVLDLNDIGKDVLNRKKKLSDKSIRRIYGGLVRHGKSKPQQMIASYYGNNSSCALATSPSPTLTTRDRCAVVFLHYVLNPSWGGHTHNIEDPCPVIVARQDKAPLYLVSAETGNQLPKIEEGDSEAVVQLKKIMIELGIARISMRMFKINEMLRIHGVEHYKMFGTQEEQKEMIGNMVHPVVPQQMARAMSRALTAQKIKEVAA